MQYEERYSTLAVTSLVLGILSLICFFILHFIFHMNIAVVVVDILLGIGAVITGVFGMRHAHIYSLKGRNCAFVGIVTGANSMGWVLIDAILSLVY